MKDKTWITQRLARHAAEVRQDEHTARIFDTNAYPNARRLAEVHARAAAVYEAALAELEAE